MKCLLPWQKMGWLLLLCVPLSAVTFTNAKRFFSPNLDGVKETLKIPLSIEEEQLEKWSVTIFKQEGEAFTPLREFESFDPREAQNLTFAQFLTRFFEKEAAVSEPPFVEWDGLDQEGTLLPEGVYYFKITAIDRSKNRQTTPYIPIVLDTTAPSASLTLPLPPLFSPNGDGRKETLPLAVTLQAATPQDFWRLKINTPTGVAVKAFTSRTTKTFTWDGTTETGAPAPEGKYNLQLTAQDLAGNVFTALPQQIALVRSYEAARLSLSLPRFSPNGDGYLDYLTLENTLSSVKGLEAWRLAIIPKTSKAEAPPPSKRRTFSGDAASFKRVLSFDGSSEAGSPLPEGAYEAQLFAVFNSGNAPKSAKRSFVIDVTPPRLSLTLKNRYFNPAALKGGERRLTLEQSARSTGDATYQAVITDAAGEIVFVTNYGAALPPTFTWDGRGFNDRRLGGEYFYTLTGADLVGNESSLTSPPFTLLAKPLTAAVTAARLSFSPQPQQQTPPVLAFRVAMNQQYQPLLKRAILEIYNPQKKRLRAFPTTTFRSNFFWEGLGQEEDNSFFPLTDGPYYYRLRAAFSTGETLNTPFKTIFIDTTPIALKLNFSTTTFSPNADGEKDFISAAHRLSPSAVLPERDTFEFTLKNERGLIFWRKNWQGKLPPSFRWRGTDQLGNPAPSGTYFYQFNTEDAAGNRTSVSSPPLRLVREKETLRLQVTPRVFSAHPKATQRTLAFSPTLSTNYEAKADFLGLWYFLNPQLASPSGEELSQTAANPNLLFNSKNTAPFTWSFPQAQSAFSPPPSGAYLLVAQAAYRSGNKTTTQPLPVFLDNLPPTVALFSRPEFFSPDGDGNQETLYLKVRAGDNHSLAKLDGLLYRLVEFRAGKPFPLTLSAYRKFFTPFKRWENWQLSDSNFSSPLLPQEKVANSIPAVEVETAWNGLGDDGSLVEAGNEYVLFVTATDSVGLKTTAKKRLQVDLFIEKLADGRLRIVLNSINFAYDSTRMLGDYQKILNRLAYLLQKFERYKVHLVGHTDSRGAESYNQRLSTARAQAVYGQLLKKGLAAERFTYEGRGERELLITPEVVAAPGLSETLRVRKTEDNYRKNRRVEFFLKRQSSPAQK